MIETHLNLKKYFQKRSHFIGNLNLFERRKKNEFKKTPRIKWFIDESKYLKENEVERLLIVAQKRKTRAIKKGRKVAVRDYYIIKVGLSTGLRVQELADLKCRDIHLFPDGLSYVFVRHGKGDKPRPVWFNGKLKQDITDYLQWKENICEDISPEAPFFFSSNTKTHMTTRALQKAFKRTIAKASINLYYSIHATRHTYGSNLYKSSGKDIIFVKDQLGHSSVQTTEVYAHVATDDRQRALDGLYNFNERRRGQ